MKTTSASLGTPAVRPRTALAQSTLIPRLSLAPERIPTLRRRAGGGQIHIADNGTAVASRSKSRLWPLHMLTDRARLVDRFLDWMVNQTQLANNPLADLRTEYGQRATTPVVQALLSPDFEAALEALRPASTLRQFSRPSDARACGPDAGHGLPLQHAREAAAPAGPISSGSAGSLWSAVDGVDSRMDEHTIRPAAGIGMPPAGQSPFQGAVSHRSNRREHSLGQADRAASATTVPSAIHLQRTRGSLLAGDGAQLSLPAITLTAAHSAHDAGDGLLRRSPHRRNRAVECGGLRREDAEHRDPRHQVLQVAAPAALGQRGCRISVIPRRSATGGGTDKTGHRTVLASQAAGRYSTREGRDLLVRVLRRARLKPATGRRGPAFTT